MPVVPVLWISSPIFGVIALVLALAAIGIAIYRKIPLPAKPAALIATGLLILCVAAAQPVWNHPKHGSIAVMVDLSPSTRGAHFRNPDEFRKRLAELIGDTPHQLLAFAAQNQPLDPAGPFTEIPADETIFSPPTADVVLLFSDARFELPKHSPPIYPIVDDGLENVADASVQSLEQRGQSLAATIANTGPPREATFPDSTMPVGTGTFIVARPSTPKSPATVKLNPDDLWPENDSLSLQILPPPTSEKWWIGPNPPGQTWLSLSPAQLPDQPEAFLSPAVIVIDNQPADSFSPAQLERLTQYVRDLGGAILILGGDHAFAAGGYTGTAIEQLSPLASFPPSPTRRWILLADASGSMAQATPTGITRWQAAAEAIVRLLPTLPPADLVQVGQFSDAIHWWIDAQSAADASSIPLPPPGVAPHGPTNLESSLQSIVEQTSGNMPTHLLLLSDCDAEITYPQPLAIRMQEKNIHLHVLAIGHGSALDPIRKIAATTGGNIIEQLDPHKWVNSIRQLSQAALPQSVVRRSIGILFLQSLRSLAPQMVPEWNHVWVKPGADLWAETLSTPTSPAGAFWHVGSGSVLALAFETDATNIDFIASSIAAKPRDPRFTITWENGVGHRVVVDAAEDRAFLNNLQIRLDLVGNSPIASEQLEQTAPGRYEAKIDPSPDLRIAILRIDNETIDRTALPARYPKEFDSLGNDHDAMQNLAQTTNGQVIWPTDRGPINFHWPNVQTPLAPWICLIALILISSGTVLWRRTDHF